MAIHPDVQLKRDKELDSSVGRAVAKIADSVDKMIMEDINIGLHGDNQIITVFIPPLIIPPFFFDFE